MPLTFPAPLPNGIDPDSGRYVEIAGSAPAGASRNVNWVVPSGVAQMLVLISGRFQTNAGAGTRTVTLQLDLPGDVVDLNVPMPGSVGPSAAMSIAYGLGLASVTATADNPSSGAALPWFLAPAGATWELYWTGSNLGDSWTSGPIIRAYQFDVSGSVTTRPGLSVGPFLYVPGPEQAVAA